MSEAVWGEPAAEYGVVAGCDGSDGARQAVTWAAEEAARRGCRLLVVDAVQWPVVGPYVLPGASLPVADDAVAEQTLRANAERILADVAGEVARAWPDLDVRTRVELGRPGEVLAEVGRAAELLVIGASGRSALPRLLLGSTAAELLHTCRRPVVVVRPAEPTPPRRVVVGVDGSSGSVAAIGFAYDFADRHGCELEAVHVWSDLPVDALEPVRAWDEDWTAVRQQGGRLLGESLTGFAERHPDVVVRHEVAVGRPAQALLAQAEGAALLVVGSHGRSTLGRLLLGSVSHAAIYHAPCPVAVLRAGEDR